MPPSPRHLAALIVSNSLLLPIGIGTALVWANLAPHSYVPFADKTHFIVNDVGRTLFLGIAAATFAASAVGARGRSALTPRDMVAIGCAAGIGFTVALFFATAAFPDGDLLDQTKMGALFSLSAVPIAALAAMMLRVGRFARS